MLLMTLMKLMKIMKLTTLMKLRKFLALTALTLIALMALTELLHFSCSRKIARRRRAKFTLLENLKQWYFVLNALKFKESENIFFCGT